MQDRFGQPLVDVGVELHVDAAAILRAEGVGDGTGQQQSSAGDGDDDVGVETGVDDG